MDVLNDDCLSLVFNWLTLKEKGRYERVSWRWKKRMYARLPSGYQYGIELRELRGRNNEPLYNDNAFLVSLLTKINENIEKIDLRYVESNNWVLSDHNVLFPSILDAIGKNCPNLVAIIIRQAQGNIIDDLITLG